MVSEFHQQLFLKYTSLRTMASSSTPGATEKVKGRTQYSFISFKAAIFATMYTNVEYSDFVESSCFDIHANCLFILVFIGMFHLTSTRIFPHQ